MKKKSMAPHEALEKIFHEPSRLAIMSALCAAESGLSFTELKDTCNLTDGNLNRHLKSLKDFGAIHVEKKFIDAKPRTTIYLSSSGLTQFSEYLGALAEVLEQAKTALPAKARKKMTLPAGLKNAANA